MSAPCPFGVCDGSGWVIDEESRSAVPCRCRAQLVAQRRASGLRHTIPDRYRMVTLNSPVVATMAPSVVRPVAQFIRRIENNLDAGRGLWLYGPPGTGKTTLAMLVSKAALDAGRTAAIYSLPVLLTRLRTTVNGEFDSSYIDLLEKLSAVDLLHIDDVGAESSSDWVLEQLYSIINSRYEDERSVVITTNLDNAALSKQIGARTVSRLAEMCDHFAILGHDHRTQGDIVDELDEARAHRL